MRKADIIILLTLLLVGLLSATLNIRGAKAAETIHIRADGSIDPPTANITTTDNVTYTFTGNNYGSIIIEKNDIIVDGASYMLQGTGGGVGINLNGRTNVTARNTQIDNFSYGIMLMQSSSNNTVSGNTITNNAFGIELYGGSSFNNTVSDNTITNNDYGIKVLDSSSGNSVNGNNVTDNYYGILLELSSSNNSVSGNTITSGTIGLVLSASNHSVVSGNTFTNTGLAVYDSYHNVVEDNTVNGRPLVYLEGVADYTVADAGQVTLVNCTGIRVENLNISRTNAGVQLSQTSNSSIVGNTIADNRDSGIWLASSSNYNSVSGNTITNNGDGILLELDSNYNSISGNTVTANSVGIRLRHVSNNSVSGNVITANTGGGVALEYNSDDNSFSENNITDNSLGVLLEFSSGNKLYHNNFINNSQQVTIDSLSGINAWDDGYPSGGNYWSDYADADLYKGPHQNETGSDDIWDHPRVFDAYNQDRYPLTTPFCWSAGDIDSDCDVDIFDIVRMAGVYGAEYPDSRYDRLCDMNLDGAINIFDIVIAAGHYGQSW